MAPTSGRLNARRLRAVRERIGVVFQNPVLALNPRMQVAESISEPLRTHTRLKGVELDRVVTQVMDDVGLPAAYKDRLPHQLSGGQCQRVGIARALSTQPDMLVLDEPTSALDVSVQAQILNLLRELRASRNLTYLLISHDLDVVGYMSDHVAVMYRGQVVEEGPVASVLTSPQHDYTTMLLASKPGAGRGHGTAHDTSALTTTTKDR